MSLLGRLSASASSSPSSTRPGAASGTPMSEINVTPLVDVMLVLVVIFIVTAPLLASAIRLNLPSTDAAQPMTSSVQAPVVLSIDAAGALFLNDQPQASLEALRLALQPIGSTRPDTELQVRADAAVPHGRVLEAIGVAQKAGLSRIGFIAQPVSAEAKPVPNKATNLLQN